MNFKQYLNESTFTEKINYVYHKYDFTRKIIETELQEGSAYVEKDTERVWKILKKEATKVAERPDVLEKYSPNILKDFEIVISSKLLKTWYNFYKSNKDEYSNGWVDCFELLNK